MKKNQLPATTINILGIVNVTSTHKAALKNPVMFVLTDLSESVTARNHTWQIIVQVIDNLTIKLFGTCFLYTQCLTKDLRPVYHVQMDNRQMSNHSVTTSLVGQHLVLSLFIAGNSYAGLHEKSSTII